MILGGSIEALLGLFWSSFWALLELFCERALQKGFLFSGIRCVESGSACCGSAYRGSACCRCACYWGRSRQCIMRRSRAVYDEAVWYFSLNCYTPTIHQIKNLKFLGVSWYKFKSRFWFDVNLYRGIWVSGFGGFRRCGILYSVEAVITSSSYDAAVTSSQSCIGSMLFYVILCCCMSFYVVLCHSMLIGSMLFYVVVCRSMLFYVVLCWLVLCCSMLFYVVLCRSMLFYVVLCWLVLCCLVYYTCMPRMCFKIDV